MRVSSGPRPGSGKRLSVAAITRAHTRLSDLSRTPMLTRVSGFGASMSFEPTSRGLRAASSSSELEQAHRLIGSLAHDLGGAGRASDMPPALCKPRALPRLPGLLAEVGRCRYTRDRNLERFGEHTKIPLERGSQRVPDSCR